MSVAYSSPASSSPNALRLNAFAAISTGDWYESAAAVDRPDPSGAVVAEHVPAAERRLGRPAVDVAADHRAAEVVAVVG